jgi:serine/threonine protein kinase
VIRTQVGVHANMDTPSLSAHSDAGESVVRRRFTCYDGDFLGRGSFGEVIRALDNQTGCFVAVKQAWVSTHVGRREAELLMGEFKMLTSLPSHPNVVRVLASCVDGGRARVFLEWVPGGSIQTLLTRAKFRLHEGTVRRLFHQALKGLAFLHQHHVIHRDIKPGNLLIGADLELKLADFGSSRLTQCAGGGPVGTQSAALQGTVRFMAPEVVHGQACAASDVWALGCTVCNMLSNEVPWTQKFPTELFDSELPVLFFLGTARPPEHIPVIPPHASAALRAILVSCFAFEPSMRAIPQGLLSSSYFMDADLPSDAEHIDEYHRRCEAAARTNSNVGEETLSAYFVPDAVGGSSSADTTAALTGSSGSSDPATTTDPTPFHQTVPVTTALSGIRCYMVSSCSAVKTAVTSLGGTTTTDPAKATVVYLGNDIRASRASAFFGAVTSPQTSPFKVVPTVRLSAFPGSDIVDDPTSFATLLSRFAAFFPGHGYDALCPTTFTLPSQKKQFDQYVTARNGVAGDGSRSDGYFIAIPAEDNPRPYLVGPEGRLRHACCVVQQYLNHPLLLGRRKVMCRVFATVSSLSPLQIHVHREGIARIASKPYEKPSPGNLADGGIHFTRLPPQATTIPGVADVTGSDAEYRRPLTVALSQLEAEHSGFHATEWRCMADAAVRLAVAPALVAIQAATCDRSSHSLTPGTCFQQFAFDFVTTAAGRPLLVGMSSCPVCSSFSGSGAEEYARVNAMRDTLLLVVDPETAAQQSVASALDGVNVTRTFLEPFTDIVTTFAEGCGGMGRRKRDELSSVQLSKLCRSAGLSGSVGAAFQTPEIDLIFVSRANQNPRRALSFMDFLDIAVNDLAPRVTSPGSPPLERLATIAAYFRRTRP